MGLKGIVGLLMAFVVSNQSMAEPTTPAIKIDYIRVYTDGAIFLHMNQRSECNTEVYTIPASSVARKEMYSLVLSAYMADRPVRLEVVNSGCTGWGTALQSVYILK